MSEELREKLYRIDGRSYKAYKDIQGGRFAFEGAAAFELIVDHVQGDPFASPSRMRVRVPRSVAGFPEWAVSSASRRAGLETLLAKAFGDASRAASFRAGSGKSGMFGIDTPGQEVLVRTAVLYLEKFVEARFVAGLPASGRRALGRAAAAMLCEDVPEVAARSLVFAALNEEAVRRAVEVNEDADALRAQLAGRKLVAFVADGAVLPRRSGVDQRPMEQREAAPGGASRVVAFESPESLRVTLEAPNAGAISGMGIAEGVTLIVGGGFHGKSTLLNALERGVYNHCPGDGREFVVTRGDAVKIRAEDGRSVAGVDISPFINNLPGGTDTKKFSTENASGSTSQAANIIEALESGAGVMLIDEDIAATNFMIRDARMQELVAKEKEPITPFIDKVRALYAERGVSSVLVIGGSGDYFEVADTVVMMDCYVPREVTGQAKAIAEKHRAERKAEGAGSSFGELTARRPDPRGIDARRGRREGSVKTRSRAEISFGEETIDLGCVSQIVCESQTRAIGAALLWARETGVIDGDRTVAEMLDAVEEAMETQGLDGIARGRPGNLAWFRRHELAAALNRMRSLSVG